LPFLVFVHADFSDSRSLVLILELAPQRPTVARLLHNKALRWPYFGVPKADALWSEPLVSEAKL